MNTSPGSSFERLVEIMRRLRAPDGCPWDREQTPASLRPFVLEETYEVLEAIEHGTAQDLCEELGDFVFEAVFIAQLEAEAGHFTIADSLHLVADKLLRRHPHVFAREAGEAPLDSARQVRTRWEEVKAVERTAGAAGATAKTLLSGIVPTLPAIHARVPQGPNSPEFATPKMRRPIPLTRPPSMSRPIAPAQAN